VTYVAEALLADLRGEFNLVILPGGMPGAKHLGESAEARSLATRTARAGGWVAAICAAPAFTLAPWGLLDGRQATCYPGLEKNFTAQTTSSPERVVVDGNIVTSRGPGTALEFSLRLVQLLAGEETARRVAADLLVK
jgi:4-methyl-5(b-hydroxyethyl)-thiazole monophosphate biosynthesis